MKALLLALLMSFLAGCVTNPYAQFYSDFTKQMPVERRQRLLPPEGEAQIISAPLAKHREEGQRIQERGYAVIGEARFRGGQPTNQQLIQQAKAVGAEIVLSSGEFSHTEHGVAPIITYQPGTTATTRHSGTVNATSYGRSGPTYGSANYSGSSTTTTQGTFDTQYVPYQNQVYEFWASFWRRTKPGVFGVVLNAISDAQREALQRNTGAVIELVMVDSPAFKANLLRGDVVIQMGEKQITSPGELIDLLPSLAGQKVTVRVIRGSQTIDVEVQLGSQP